MRSQQIRQTFLDFFANKGHTIVPSASLVPGNDKTLLFTNAGMVPFKDVFLGQDQRSYSRATTAQRCVRAGGKHNDLENVGYTARHHTFFEMLGNFSFGDYFKEDAIRFAWELVTETFGLPPEKLWITVFEDDDEAFAIWAKQIGVPENRISRIGAKDNFWQMGDTGPCGPCSEIFYDHGEHIWGGPPGTPEEDGDRFIEIWNLVFMQYDRQADGELLPLPKPSVDTGMGLERIAAILQGVHANYEIDLFVNLIDAAGKATHTSDLSHNSLKVIADHIRSVVFLLVDGVVPSNEGRGYVLRRIMRRAIRHGYKLGQKQPFFYRLVEALVAEMGVAYPEIAENQIRIEEQIRREEERFGRTISEGMDILENDLATLTGDTISGETLFKLYDTYGFPVDLTADIARERNLQVDMAGYEAAMARQVAQSQASGGFKGEQSFKTTVKTEFTGYEQTQATATVSEIFIDFQSVSSVHKGDAVVILDSTPFYGESGGQIGDMGEIRTDDAVFVVTDTQKQGDAFLHYGYMEKGTLNHGDKVTVSVDSARREAIMRNHSATHLLHSALRRVLGQTVEQKGSLVTDERLRFDFSYDQPISAADLQAIEELANADVLANYPVSAEQMSQDAALDKGAMALFGEKYGDVVRVLTMGPHSIELCGGTHVSATGNIGQIVVTAQSGVAAGIRRIEAVTGWQAIHHHRQKQALLQSMLTELKATPDSALSKITQLVAEKKQLQQQIKQLKQQALTSQSTEAVFETRQVNGFNVITALIEGYDVAELRALADQLRDKHALDLVVLATKDEDKAKLVVSVAKAAIDRLHAGQIVGEIAKHIDGKGGGRPDFAQAGGSRPEQLQKALAAVDTLLQAR
ncbi:alanine--tRNA ligase [Ostreibacterium oceani]|uniref:Alanine--tRNA ligase n=1 Tax=Ostreibacterium oceani TaxID=2654998 RepID=A0A6N7EUR7_9GAMM|nr:alanine--tRNA ligase [Ostreibacterium oceani]MPV85260.1 alanine--tRNA ligase [Ostreibacterium oceani]